MRRRSPDPPLFAQFEVAQGVRLGIRRGIWHASRVSVDPLLHVDPCADMPRADLPLQTPGHFEVLAEDGDARAGRLWTAHGPMHTPCFMPVGTYGAVKGLLSEDLRSVGSQTILANAYHLTHRPGHERVRSLGGLHQMMDYAGPILTDSGGFQVFSLRGLQKIDDEGVDYRTHFDGSKHRMTPESVLQVQANLGSDICMVLDHCPPGDASTQQMQTAMDRTTRWAERAAAARRELLAPGQLCFGIVQGGTDLALRAAHVRAMEGLDFDGFALGGLSVGEPVPRMHATMAEVAPTLPTHKPRYVMGIGTPWDLWQAVSSGVDMFDCVIPSRHARNGQLFTWEGRLNIKGARFRDDGAPVDHRCPCATCQRFTRAYLRHLHESGDPLYVRLATLHNIAFFHQFVGAMRQALLRGNFGAVSKGLFGVISEHYLPEEASGKA